MDSVIAVKGKRYSLYQAKMRLDDILDRLPQENECFKLFSPPGGWSSCALVMWFAGKTNIKSIKISTLRVGKKELLNLIALGIKDVQFILGGIQKHNTDGYSYDKIFEMLCSENDIKYTYCRNHSKIILLDTDNGKFAIETSSNFNENPQMEQFSIENNECVYNFYAEFFKEI